MIYKKEELESTLPAPEIVGAEKKREGKKLGQVSGIKHTHLYPMGLPETFR